MLIIARIRIPAEPFYPYFMYQKKKEEVTSLRRKVTELQTTLKFYPVFNEGSTLHTAGTSLE